jgi:hypothetical protein
MPSRSKTLAVPGDSRANSRTVFSIVKLIASSSRAKVDAEWPRLMYRY